MDPDPKERLNLMSAYHCHQIKFGFDILTGNNRTHDQVVRDCNLHPYCEYDTSRARCIDKPEHPELNAKYQEPCAKLDQYRCVDNPKCYYDTKTSECKRDATKLSNEELQELMDQTVLHLGIKSNGGKRKRRDNHKRSKRNKISKISKRNKRSKRSIKHSYK